MNSSRIYAFVLNPWVVIGSLAIGGTLGLFCPSRRRNLASSAISMSTC